MTEIKTPKAKRAPKGNGDGSFTRHGMTIKPRNDSPGAKYVVRITFQKKKYERTLAETVDESFEIAVRERRAIYAQRFEDLAPALRQKEATLTFAQVFAVYMQFEGDDRPSKSTREANIRALQVMVRGPKPGHACCGRKKSADGPVIDIGPMAVSILTHESLWKWQEAKRAESAAAHKAGDEFRASQILRTANSTVRFARSVFADTADLRTFYRMHKIKFPEGLEAWRTEPMFGGCTKKEYRNPGDHVIAKTFAWIESLIAPITIAPFSAHVAAWQLQTLKLDQEKLNQYKACWLALGFGFRAGDIGKAKNNWFQRINGVMFVSGDKIRKNKKIAEVRAQMNAWEHLAPFVGSDPEAFFLEGSMTQRTSQVFKNISRDFKALGWRTGHHTHELRAWVGCQIAMASRLEDAQIFMDHAQYQTTENYYGHHLKKNLPEFELAIPTLSAFEPRVLPDAAVAA